MRRNSSTDVDHPEQKRGHARRIADASREAGRTHCVTRRQKLVTRGGDHFAAIPDATKSGLDTSEAERVT
ncbi:hypothetical protein [Frateuria defendens]|uniref:hypothetical protein n=1 Tax=Frateuria defendens TaxID=2219559 RepID=UPI001293674D|nr:hypothetical protein [Frateuria defendens]